MTGICIVFLLLDKWGEFLAETVVRQIRCHTSGPFRIYACALRPTPAQQAFLSGLDIRFIDVPPQDSASPTTNQKEHSYLLDQLVSRAFVEGCERVATFDMDSWPLLTGWDEFYASFLTDQAPVAAIVRTEFGDNFPLAAFTMLTRAFWREGQSSFASIDQDVSRSQRPAETGSGILDQLVDESRKFYRLERTNRWNPHPIIAGVYDDAVFHLGAGSRRPIFKTDAAQYLIRGRKIRRDLGTELNGAMRDAVLRAMQGGHDPMIAELLEGDGERFLPILSDAASLPMTLQHTPRDLRTRVNV